MRFNDQLQTVLAAPADSDSAAVTLWRQCVDLIAQHDRPGSALLDRESRDALMERLEGLRPRVPESQRLAAVHELGSRLRSPTLIRFFAADRPAIAVAAMARASLPDLVWPGIIPALGPAARGVLRGRRDTGPETTRALAAYGAVDLVLDGEKSEPASIAELLLVERVPVAIVETRVVEAPVVETPVEETSLTALVDRIKAFTDARRERDAHAGGRAEDGSLVFDTSLPAMPR